nr:unnamed protein product [Digitaria exilis]
MASSKLQLPADDSVLLFVTHSIFDLSTFAADKLWRNARPAPPSPPFASSSACRLHLPAHDSVLLLVTHSNLSTFAADKTLAQDRHRRRLQLRDDDTGAMVADLDDDAAPLVAAYTPLRRLQHPRCGSRSFLAHLQWIARRHTSLVDKCKMCDEAYHKLDGKFE